MWQYSFRVGSKILGCAQPYHWVRNEASRAMVHLIALQPWIRWCAETFEKPERLDDGEVVRLAPARRVDPQDAPERLRALLRSLFSTPSFRVSNVRLHDLLETLSVPMTSTWCVFGRVASRRGHRNTLASTQHQKVPRAVPVKTSFPALVRARDKKRCQVRSRLLSRAYSWFKRFTIRTRHWRARFFTNCGTTGSPGARTSYLLH